MRSKQVDRVAERATLIAREIDAFIRSVEDMKREPGRRPRAWKGACNYCIRKLVTLKKKILYVIQIGPEMERWAELRHFVAIWMKKSRGGAAAHMNAFYARHYVG